MHVATTAAAAGVSVAVYDGDNSVDGSTGSQLSTAFPGEAPRDAVRR
jgi:hypothetical protein